MLKIIDGLPNNILGVTAEDKVTGTDYETILISAVKEMLKTNKKIRVLYHLKNSFSGFDISAMIDDSKMGIKHVAAWEKIALVSDHQIMNSLAKFFGYMFPCELRIFKDTELKEAKKMDYRIVNIKGNY